jgi:hypothetical protein
LNVVTDLVCDHIRLGEVAWCGQAPFNYAVEARIDLELLIPRAIEWADVEGRVAAPAGGHAIAKHDERGMLLAPGALP